MQLLSVRLFYLLIVSLFNVCFVLLIFFRRCSVSFQIFDGNYNVWTDPDTFFMLLYLYENHFLEPRTKAELGTGQAPTSYTMKLITWNTNGLRATIKQGYFEPLFEKYDPDILCLQETKAELEQIGEEYRNHPYTNKSGSGKKNYFSFFESSKARKGYSGVAIYSKVKPEKVEYGIGVPELDREGRSITAHYKDFILINCYFPNGGGAPERLAYKLEFYDAFLVMVNELKKKGKKIIFCGDVNVAHTEIDLARPKENSTHVGFLPEERAWMDEVIANGWTDVFRHFYPTKKDAYTYWDQYSHARERNVGWRIDYFFVSPNLLTSLKGTKILSDYYGSDHCPLELDIKMDK